MIRALLILGGVVLLAGFALLVLVPLDEETCAQLYEERTGQRSHDAALGRSSAWDCLVTMNRLQQKAAEEERERLAQAARERELYADQSRLEAQQRQEAEQLAVKRKLEAQIATENEAGLLAQFRGPLCARLSTLGERSLSLSLLRAKGDVWLYSLESHCPDCRYLVQPEFTFHRLDGSVFCTGGGTGRGDCREKLAALQVLTQSDHTGSGDFLRTWLTCP